VILRLTRAGLELGPPVDLDAARRDYAARSGVLIRGFLAADLVQDLQRRAAAVPFTPRVDTGVTVGALPVDAVMTDPGLEGRIRFLFNDPALFRAIESLTGCGSIGSFRPTMYRMLARDGHFDTWHDDMDGNRMVALSVNLTMRPFEGGVLQVREKADGRIVFEVANRAAGDAVLFPIDSRLQHRVSAVTGDVPRLVVAGWFQHEPRYAALLPRVAERAM
jgi:hypothetical protein